MGTKPQVARRILIVEDNADSADATTRLLKLQGHVVDVCGTLKDAKRLIRQCNYDVILCDIVLPDGSGMELPPFAKSFCPPVKLVAMTGRNMPQDIQAMQGAGFHEHLLKPVTSDLLYRAVG